MTAFSPPADDSSLRPVFLDTNVLLAATVPGRSLHEDALEILERGPNLGIPMWISTQVLREYLSVATRPEEVGGLGLPVAAALANADSLGRRFYVLEESREVHGLMTRLIRETRCRGKQVHDAQIAATAIFHGAEILLTHNVRDFRRFRPYLKILALQEARLYLLR